MAREIQIDIAGKLGVDVRPDTEAVAAAKIEDAIAPALDGEDGSPQSASEGQVKYAQTLGLDVTSDSLRVASARIADVLLARNRAALEILKLVKGDWVIRETTLDRSGKSRTLRRIFAVSSIRKDGLVYFKGGNGQCAWASQLRRATEEEAVQGASGQGYVD